MKIVGKELTDKQIESLGSEPMSGVRWQNIEDVVANNYNPNSVASVEIKLLQKSILKDGYTQPVVTIFDDKVGKFVIVDGFHRFTCMKINKEIRERHFGMLPIVVLEKSMAERMAATVRHNRARGKHSTDGMTSIVFSMAKQGLSDAEICNELGMEEIEVIKLKHISGFSKLFSDVEYSKEWKSENMVKLEKAEREGKL